MAELQVVTFSLGKEDYAIPIAQIRGIIQYSEVTKLPNVPTYMEGVISHRGTVVSVIDLAKFFSIAGSSKAEKCALMLEVGGTEVAAMIDRVSEVISLDETMIEPPPASMVTGNYITGIGKMGNRLLILVDAALLIQHGGLGFTAGQN